MRVRALLEAKPAPIVIAKPSTGVDEAMELLISNNIGCLPVVDDSGQLAGIVSDKDILKKIHEAKGDYHALSMKDVMTTEVIVGVPDDDIEYIAGIMDKNWIRHIPIMDGEDLIGVVSLRDVNKTLVKATKSENRYLNMYMDSLHRRDRSGDH
ncbi:MAG: CBS domain-containing protein [candidate division Zixibacteria bacterium]|nr:CBS domain-containing protein [candidate division Zixibacteria bacterium]